MLRIEDYYTDAPSAGIITMLDKPEIVNRLLNTFICNFKGFNYMKLKIDVAPVREELEEYKDLNQEFLDQIRKLRAFYDGNQLALKRILRDINYDTHLNTKVFSPVVGCPIGCSYCFTKKVVEHFCITDNYNKQVFRGFYKIHKDSEGNDIPELFNIDNDDPIDWFLNYMSDFGCWKPEWQENVLQQVVVSLLDAGQECRCLFEGVDSGHILAQCIVGIQVSLGEDGTFLRNEGAEVLHSLVQIELCSVGTASVVGQREGVVAAPVVGITQLLGVLHTDTDIAIGNTKHHLGVIETSFLIETESGRIVRRIVGHHIALGILMLLGILTGTCAEVGLTTHCLSVVATPNVVEGN